MAKPIKEAISYVGRVAKRTIGMEAWQAGQSWDLAGVDLTAPALAFTETVFPVLSRFFGYDLKTPEQRERHNDFQNKHINLAVGGLIATASAEMGLFMSIFLLSHHPWEIVVFKLTANATAHITLDLGSTIGKGTARILRHFRPPTATLTA